MSSERSDELLMSLVSSGDHAAFAELVARYTDQYFALAVRSLNDVGDAEDVVQNGFVKLWQNPSSWNPSKSKFTTWFYRVIINACHDLHRKSNRLLCVDDEQLEQGLTHKESEEHGAQHRQSELNRQQALEHALTQLPSSQRDAINLVVYLELPQREAAQIMGVSLKALESLLVRAKRSMAKSVQQQSTGIPAELNQVPAVNDIPNKLMET